MLVDFSTIGPEITRQFAVRLPANWLDCPASGGVGGAESGRPVIFAGGEAPVLTRAKPLLKVLAEHVTHMGATGTGQATKLCNQLIVASNLVAIAEAMALGERMGVDATQLPEALKGGFADSLPLQLFGPRMATVEDPGPPVGALATMYKDVRAIRVSSGDAAPSLRLLDRVEAIYAAAEVAGLSATDLPGLMRLYRA